MQGWCDMNDVPPPPRALGPVTSDMREAVLPALRKCPATPSQEAMEWAEKLRRFTSLYGRNLRTVAHSRLGSIIEDHLNWMAQVLVKGSIHCDEGRACDDQWCTGQAPWPARRGWMWRLERLEAALAGKVFIFCAYE